MAALSTEKMGKSFLQCGQACPERSEGMPLSQANAALILSRASYRKPLTRKSGSHICFIKTLDIME
jgi:hypothetical protein